MHVLTITSLSVGTDRELDLKVRQWYGHYPTKLVVDEIVSLFIIRRDLEICD